MSNEIALQQERLAGLATAVNKTQQTAPRVGTDPFLKMGKDGIWTYGQKDIEVQDGSMWAISPFSYRTGYTCWSDYDDESGKKNENFGKVTVELGAEPVNINNLAQHVDPDSGQTWKWAPVVECELVCISGEDEGTRVLYQTSSTGGLRLMSDYLDKLGTNIQKNTPVAIVKLDHDHYMHKQWGKTYTPEMEYVEWRALDDAAAPAAQIEAAPEKGDTPPLAKEADGAAPAPTRRRRPAA